MLVWPFTLATREGGKCVYRRASGGARGPRGHDLSPQCKGSIKCVVRKTYIVAHVDLFEYLILYRVFGNISISTPAFNYFKPFSSVLRNDSIINNNQIMYAVCSSLLTYL